MDDDTLAAPSKTPGFGGMETVPGEAALDGASPPKESPKIGRFDVLRVLGQGGMGRVYTAYDEQLDRRVAIKVLRRDVGEQSRRRVEREAKAMAKLTHPNVVQVYEVGEHAGELFIAMEFVKGTALDEWQSTDDRTWPEILAAYRQAGEGLAAAHEAGMVHRDFKPQNAIVETGEDGQVRVRVLDFGLARQAGELATADDDGAPTETIGPVDAKLTATGSLLGTPAYMAPEQFATSEVGAAADQFGFCVALWEGLYGERPFHGATLPSLVHSVTKGKLREPPKNSPVPAWVRDVLRRGLTVAPEDRWPSMRELLGVLARDPTSRRNKWVAAIAGITLVGSAGAIVQSRLGSSDELCPDSRQLLVGIWDDARREAASAAFAATELPFADRAWATAKAALDPYAGAWATMHQETCEATELRGEQPAEVMHLRMACLQHARVGLEAATSLIADADADVVSRTDALIEGLDELDRCADVDALRNDVPPPRAQHRETVERARALLTHSRAQHEAFRYDQANRTSKQAQELVARIDYAPVHAEITLERGYDLHGLGDSEGALAAYRSALQHAAQSGQTKIQHQAVVRMMYIQGYELGRPGEALQLRELNLGLAAGLEAEDRAWAHTTMGAVLDAKGEHEAAIDWHRKGLALWESIAGPDQDGALMARDQLGRALAAAGQHTEARTVVRESVQLRAKRLGADHPTVATARMNVGRTLMIAKQHADAEVEFRGALELISRVLGPDHTAVGRWRNDLADALLAQRKLDQAKTEYQLALDAQVEIYGTAHPNVARSREGLEKVAKARTETAAHGDPASRPLNTGRSR